jgi:hypothetical protein
MDHGVVRVRFGSRTSKAFARALVAHFELELGSAARVVLRRNHEDEGSTKLVVGVEFFSTSVQYFDESVWSGGPAHLLDKQCGVVPRTRSLGKNSDWRACPHIFRWMEKPAKLVADLLVDMLATSAANETESLGTGAEIFGLLLSLSVGVLGCAFW